MKQKPDHARLLEKFGTDGRRRPPLRRTRGQIDRRCMLPDLPTLLEIDRHAELAVAGHQTHVGERGAADRTGEPSGAVTAGRGTL